MSFDLSEQNIPDFDDMLKVTEEIKNYALLKSKLELKIQDLEASTTIELTTNPEHYINGKPPSMSFIKSTYLMTGLDGVLMKYRQKLGEVESELEYLKNKLYIYRDMIDVWRTISANKRASVM